MAMGTRRERQEEFWIPTCTLARPDSHPFYQRLEQLLAEHDFDRFVEGRCRRFYAAGWGGQAWHRESIFGCCWWVTSKAWIVNGAWRGERGTRCGGDSAERGGAGPHDPIANATADRTGDASRSVRVGAGVAGRCGTDQGPADRDGRHHSGSQCGAALDRTAGQRRELRRVSERLGTAVGSGDAHAGRSGACGSETKKEGVEPGVGQPA